MSRRRGAALAVPVLALLTTGCTIRSESAPRDIPPERRNEYFAEPDTGAGDSIGDERIYLVVANAGTTQLRTVSRDTGSSPDALLEQLFEGPNGAERSAGLTTALPAGLELAAPIRVEAGVVTVDLAGDLELAGSELPAAIAQIVFTATQLPNAERVQLRVDGEIQPWPDGGLSERTDPLSIYDFPGYAESFAPDYPAVPLPPAPPPTTTLAPPVAPPETTPS